MSEREKRTGIASRKKRWRGGKAIPTNSKDCAKALRVLWVNAHTERAKITAAAADNRHR